MPEMQSADTGRFKVLYGLRSQAGDQSESKEPGERPGQCIPAPEQTMDRHQDHRIPAGA